MQVEMNGIHLIPHGFLYRLVHRRQQREQLLDEASYATLKEASRNARVWLEQNGLLEIELEARREIRKKAEDLRKEAEAA